MSVDKKTSRGRPKTFDRNSVLDIAQQSYWENGINQVSINELCKIANVSKPSVYREFGNEDGLMCAVLEHYENTVLNPVVDLLNNDAPFNETLSHLIHYSTSVDNNLGMPKGCLFTNMKAFQMHLGESTVQQIDRTYEHVIDEFTAWIERSRARNEINETNLDCRFIAIYIYAQISFAQSQMMNGEATEDVKAILQLALSMF
ncbi:hypothetical protein BCU68_11640 [Vibrio sp. 10N.286.49.B3]|uniref:TetR/AcrR family transcriptional regulator n=1 Tax=Vibrio sp. 10N.286.49.B3 TaxID=1880855 RepID=UPI000C83744E|nr:TetR/AcrR family transcriptional regulator [Vibrio sp. 10N.286.49.B3]PMH44797.1 hypothetical protein BCU68_11640 [Vibrio sp. 10N.286.49.B3]